MSVMINLAAFVSFMSFIVTALAYNASRAQVRGLTKQVFRLTKACTEAELNALDIKSKLNQKCDILNTWSNSHNDLIEQNTNLQAELAVFKAKQTKKREWDKLYKRQVRAEKSTLKLKSAKK
jgi:sensor histidine kinase YesM